ncbi:MAG: signal peptidase I [Armatimonadetes bacterium]|nr:signal peptidase I [Armatimonadota bacterium]MDE2205326.1 signal peptidase I [Armatimonadota bacterium]
MVLLSFRAPVKAGAASQPLPAARTVADILESLIVAGVLVFLIVRPFFVQAFYIPSESMEPTLMGHDAGVDPATNEDYQHTIHDHLFVDKLAYRFHPPRRGDIIVFLAPKRADIEDQNNGLPEKQNVLIKRLIGIPGDTILVKDGAVYRNGKRLNEPYIKEPMKLDSHVPFGSPGSPGDPAIGVPPGAVHLAPGELWVMGDNRNNSSDSRYWGPLRETRVIGRADCIFWPLDRIRILH